MKDIFNYECVDYVTVTLPLTNIFSIKNIDMIIVVHFQDVETTKTATILN